MSEFDGYGQVHVDCGGSADWSGHADPGRQEAPDHLGIGEQVGGHLAGAQRPRASAGRRPGARADLDTATSVSRPRGPSICKSGCCSCVGAGLPPTAARASDLGDTALGLAESGRRAAPPAWVQ